MRGGKPFKLTFKRELFARCHFLRFMETFKSRYPVLRIFLHKCVAQARASCCVETMSGRWSTVSLLVHLLWIKTEHCRHLSPRCIFGCIGLV